MILYHGSNIEIDEILLSKGRHGKGNQIIEKDMTATDRQFMIECLCEDIVPMILE